MHPFNLDRIRLDPVRISIGCAYTRHLMYTPGTRSGRRINRNRYTIPMTQHSSLTPEEREFFTIVREAGLANPFSARRIDMDQKISAFFPGISSRAKRIDRTVGEVNRRIRKLEKEGRADLALFPEPDRKLIEAAFLFEFFYKFRQQFDRLIENQIKAGDTSIRVGFAAEALALLRKRGFSHEDSQRFFSLGYQLRRAFFFIGRTLVGRSKVMRNLRRNLWENVFTHSLELYNRYLWNRLEDFSTLLLGETGTGKGTAAMAMGRSGFIPFNERRKCFVESFTRSFVSLNFSQFPETLVESELFGHKKGAFTGAVKDFKGIFDRCSPYGAILLDEIGEISTPVQIKLLQVLQERIFTPVGSHDPSRFQGRVIAATNRSIEEIRQKNVFRDDFYYRLCSDIITVPPLRRRIQEDPRELNDLLAHTVQRMVGQPSPELIEMTQNVIDKHLGPDYPWPGNVRELEQCVRSVLLRRSYAGDTKSTAPDLESLLTRGIRSGQLDAQNLVSGYCHLLYQRHGTFEEVARRTRLDRRTVKKYIQEWENKV